jgi:hypothetical protein
MKSAEVAGNVLVDAALKQRAVLAGIDDGGAELAQIPDGSVDDIDRLMIGRGEELLIHELANDADADSPQAPFSCELGVTVLWNPADAVDGEVIRRIVAGDDVEDAGDVLDGAAGRAIAIVEPAAADHPIAANQPLRLRKAHSVVETRRHADRWAAFLRNRARHEVRRDRRGRAAT